tara:strand:- start:1730 stop:1951 length:222 start_codon:yes stop_codon:yes gene_type:complete
MKYKSKNKSKMTDYDQMYKIEKDMEEVPLNSDISYHDNEYLYEKPTLLQRIKYGFIRIGATLYMFYRRIFKLV